MTSRSGTHLRTIGLLAAALLLLLLARLYQLTTGGFDGLYGQDAYAYYTYAIGPLRESVLSLSAPPPFVWPPGYPYLIALTSLVTGIAPQAGQSISLLAGLLTPIFTALFAWEVWGRARGNSWSPLLAGLLVAMSGQFWQSSIVVMADSAALAAGTFGMWTLARYGRQPEASRHNGAIGWLLLATAGLSFAVLTRWAYALVALPATGYALLILWRRRAWLAGLLAGAIVLLILSPIWLSFLNHLLEPVGAGPTFSIDLQVYSWHPLNALRRSFITADGLLQYRLPNGLYYLSAPAHRYFFTPLLALLLLPGLWFTWRQRTAALIWLVWGWAGIIFLFHAGAPYQNFRFTLVYLPPLAVVAAIGATEITRAAGRWRPIVVALVVTGLIWMAWGGWTLSDSFIGRKNDDLALIQWTETATEDVAQLITFNQTATFRQYSDLETYELYFQTPAGMAELLEKGAPLFLLVDVESIETQWQGRSPSENYRWLRDSPGLQELGQSSSYTLFRVNVRATDDG